MAEQEQERDDYTEVFSLSTYCLTGNCIPGISMKFWEKVVLGVALTIVVIHQKFWEIYRRGQIKVGKKEDIPTFSG